MNKPAGPTAAHPSDRGDIESVTEHFNVYVMLVKVSTASGALCPLHRVPRDGIVVTGEDKRSAESNLFCTEMIEDV